MFINFIPNTIQPLTYVSCAYPKTPIKAARLIKLIINKIGKYKVSNLISGAV